MLKRSKIYSALLLTLILFSTAFAQNEKKTAYSILLDNTGSLRSQLNYVIALGKGTVKHIYQQGPVALFDFKTKSNGSAVVETGVEWSQNRTVLDNYIDGLFIIGGHTTLFDAVYSMADALNTKVSLNKDAFDNKVIILITDGEDRVSKVKDKQLIEKLKESGIKVYAVGLIQELDSRQKAKAEDFFKRVTEETGGNVVFPESNRIDIDNLLNELFAEPRRKSATGT